MPSFTLAPLQKRFMEHGAPLLTGHLPRGSGKSYVMAIAALEMAVQGRTVYLYDPSIIFTFGVNFAAHRHFERLVAHVADAHFSEYEFEISSIDHTLRCLGWRNAPTPVTPSPVQEVSGPEIDDDGSDENV